ncbi:acetyl-CoA synthetase-like protein [Phlegmacium glaucopus]|nr:acetyl-CoA synthetase-like protein [Phlegmacium glaucopus]
MYLKSPYPDVPPLPNVNVHYLFFKQPGQDTWPDFTFHIDAETGEEIMYRDFLGRIRDLATGLEAPVSQGGLGIRAEDNEMIGIMGENSSDYIALVQACIQLATPFAPISSYSTAFELKHALNLTKVTRLFVDAKFVQTALPVAKELGIDLNHIYVMKGHAKGRKSLWSIIKDVRRNKIPPVGIRTATKDTLAYLVFSSGTSGLPKAVKISHGNIIFALGQMAVTTEVAAQVLPPDPEFVPITLAFLPMHHTYGLFVFCFRAMLAINTLVFLPKWDINAALKAIPKYKVSILTLIPSVVHQLVNHPGIEKADFSSVLSIRSGAAYLPKELSSKLTSFAKDASFMEGYGMSEVTISAISQPTDGSLDGKLTYIPGSTGVLIPSMEARIMRDDSTDANVNEPGELWLRGNNVALGYWNNEKADKETFVDGWVHTGDKFWVDEGGNFWFADRAKDTLKVSGAQVSPVEIENCLLQHPEKLINDVTVAGVSGGRISDEKIPRAWIVLTPAGKKRGVAAVVRELDAWHKKNLSRYKWLRGGIQVVDEIPKSPTGKVLRRVLQDRYEASAGKLKGKL